MVKKRSKGVTFWGWAYIVFSIIGFLGAINPQQQIKLFGIVLCAANLICGIFILKLNEIARKAAIILGVISIISIPFYFRPMLEQVNSEDLFAKNRQMIIERTKPEYQQEALANLEKGKEVSKKVVPIIIVAFFGAPLLILELIPIIFFTRPKVKEQFK